MELILKITNHDYSSFLDTKIDSFIVALQGFSSDHLVEYTIEELKIIVNKIHDTNKKIYLCLNIIANEKKLEHLTKLLPQIKLLNIDGYVVSDYGFLQLLIDEGERNKIIFNPITTITNKYSSDFCNKLGIDHVCIANELNFNDIVEIAHYTSGNIEILAQGYYQICNSKRPLITNFLKKFKLHNKSTNYYIKEETRDYSYPIIEVRDDLLIYIDKQRCILPYLQKLKDTNIKYYRIDTTFLNVDEVKKIIDIYHSSLKENMENTNDLSTLVNLNSNPKCLDNISILKKEDK